jgi:arsenite methyltransferase
VGDKGRVIGVDMTPEMIQRAIENAIRGKYRNVEFKLGEMENLPIDDGSIDVVISNCVINHSPDKLATFKEILRVLKPGGRILISDLVAEEKFPEDILRSINKVWAEWIIGALGKVEYLSAIKEAGFKDVTIAAENTFSMSEMDNRLKGKIISIQVKAHK